VHFKYYYYSRLISLFWDNLAKLTPESLITLDFNEARDGGWQWHRLNHMQIICTLTSNRNSTYLSLFTDLAMWTDS